MSERNYFTVAESVVMFFSALGVMLLGRLHAFDFIYTIIPGFVTDLQSESLNIFSKIKDDLSFFSSLNAYQEEKKSLENTISKLVSEKVLLEKENNELKIIAKQLSFNNVEETVPARVIKYDQTKTEIIINKGLSDKIQQGNAVVFENYIVGIVTEVYERTCHVKLINSTQSYIQAHLTSDKEVRGIVSGDIGSILKFSEVLVDSNINNNDIVVTDGRDGFIPQGLILGRVKSIDKDQTKVTLDAEIEPMINLKDLSLIFVVISS